MRALKRGVGLLSMLIRSRLLLPLSLVCWLYVSPKLIPSHLWSNPLLDPHASQNPEILLLKQTTGLAFHSPRPAANVRAEELFRDRGDTRNEIYARSAGFGRNGDHVLGRCFTDLGQQLNIPCQDDQN